MSTKVTKHTKNSRQALFGLTLQVYAKEKRPTIPALTSLHPAALLISMTVTQNTQGES
jgi:hypothetical protein